MKLALGTAQFGLDYGISNQHGKVLFEEMKAILDLASDNGIDTLDTAITYGEAEQRLGQIGVQEWRIVSKLPELPESCENVVQWVVDAVVGSLRRLKTSSLYGLLLHRPEQILEKDGNNLSLALQELKRKRLVQKVGISIYDPSELDVLITKFQPEIVQAPFNILDRRLLDSGWMSRLSQSGTELHVRSIFLQGLLLMNRHTRPVTFSRWKTLWNQWDTWLTDEGISSLQACSRYVFQFPFIDKVIVGVASRSQLTEIIAAVDGTLPNIPERLWTNDVELINPSRWNAIR